ISMLVSILQYYKFTFFIQGEELIVQSGILTRKKLSIPFDRIQAVNIEQNLVHKLFDVVMVKIDTAGSSTQEFELDAVSHATAFALKELVLQNPIAGTHTISDGEDAPAAKRNTSILHVDLGTLLKAGLVENHLKSGGLIIAAVFWLGQNLSDIGIDVMQNADEVNAVLHNLLNLAILVIAFLVISIIISMTRMVVVNYDLRFFRQDNQFKIVSGL